MDGEGVNATSGSPVLGGALWCGYLCNVLGIYGDVEVGSADCESIKSFGIMVFLHIPCKHGGTYLLYLPCRLAYTHLHNTTITFYLPCRLSFIL